MFFVCGYQFDSGSLDFTLFGLNSSDFPNWTHKKCFTFGRGVDTASKKFADTALDP